MKKYTAPEIIIVDIDVDVITESYGDTDTPQAEFDW